MVLSNIKGMPTVRYEEEGNLLIKGRWISENAVDFYQSLAEWGGRLNIDKLTVEVDLNYMNPASSKYLLSFFEALDANRNIRKMVVNWFYEMGKEDSRLTGQMLSKSLQKAKFRYRLNMDGI
jgi:hypothetical protein